MVQAESRRLAGEMSGVWSGPKCLDAGPTVGKHGKTARRDLRGGCRQRAVLPQWQKIKWNYDSKRRDLRGPCEFSTPWFNHCDLHGRICRGADQHPVDFLADHTADAFVVSCLFARIHCLVAGLCCWIVDDEKVGRAFIHRICRAESDCLGSDGNLAHSRLLDTCRYCILCAEEPSSDEGNGLTNRESC